MADAGPRVPEVAGAAAVRAHGWWHAHRFLLLRRASQGGILVLFLLGPLAGIWILKGNLSASLLLGTVPLTDPFVLVQGLAARHLPETAALLGAAIVAAFYGALAGRMFCSWACPVNVVTDAAAWLRRRLKLGAGRAPAKSLRWWLLVAVLLASAVTGQMAWEAVNPVSIAQRALIFGGALAWGVVAAVFLFDLLVASHGWCGHVCPVGASYALIGSKPLLRVAATRSARCDDCGDCFAVCPEPQVIVMPLKGKAGHGPVITDRECTACGRCIDVCAPDVFTFTHRFDTRRDPA
jgi:ferredoxin-type protein NapH